MKIYFLFTLFFLINCSSIKQSIINNCANEKFEITTISQDSIKNIQNVSYCDLEKFSGKAVRVKFIYTRSMEYSGLSSINGCKLKKDKSGWGIALGHPAQFFEKEIYLKFKNHKLWDEVFDTHIEEYAILDIVGVFHNYLNAGHSGSNYGHFEILAIKVCGKFYSE